MQHLILEPQVPLLHRPIPPLQMQHHLLYLALLLVLLLVLLLALLQVRLPLQQHLLHHPHLHQLEGGKDTLQA